jgi:hypothetical protein
MLLISGLPVVVVSEATDRGRSPASTVGRGSDSGIGGDT